MNPEMDEWLDWLHTKVTDDAAELMELSYTCAREARFGRAYAESNLRQLTTGVQVLKVGAGSFFPLSWCVTVTASPLSSWQARGSRIYDRLRSLVVAQAIGDKRMPVLMEVSAESLEIKNSFGLAFSVNVMKHVSNLKAVINSFFGSLTAGSIYRFTCPNYLFPYEPHFNMPTLISRMLTEKMFRKCISNCKAMPDPVGVWNSLN